MPFQTTTTRYDSHVHWRVAGPTSLQNFVELVDEIAQDTLRRGDASVLVDLRAVQGRLKFTEQIAVGELVAQKLAHTTRVASLVPADQITRNSERVAVKKGAQLRVFTHEAQAVAWLVGPVA